jgi:hypothetical protein
MLLSAPDTLDLMGGDIPDPSPLSDVERLDAIGQHLAGVDAALERLDDESYGSCEVCGVSIRDALLLADPLLVRCAEHSATTARLERPVGVFAGNDPLFLRSQHPEGGGH